MRTPEQIEQNIKVMKCYYAGRKILSDRKLGHILKEIDEKEEPVIFRTNGTVTYAIGEIIEVTFEDERSFKRETTNTYLPMDDERVKQARIQNALEKEEHKTMTEREAMRKQLDNIENMTVKELKKWATGNYRNRRLLKQYLEAIL